MADALKLEVKRHDTEPAVLLTVKNADGSLFDFSGYTALQFHMRPTEDDHDCPTKVNATATTPAAGQLLYTWSAGDTDTMGKFDGEFQGLTSGGKKRTFPRKGFLTIIITADLDNA